MIKLNDLLTVNSAEKYYVRFGDIPSGGLSTNWFKTEKEKGVSVYEVKWIPSKNKWFIVVNSDEGIDTLISLAGDFQVGRGRPIYLIKAVPTKYYGADDEPLLDSSSLKIVKKLNPTELWNHELGDEWHIG